MSNHVAVITDSTACIPDQLASQWGIRVVQVQLQVGDRLDDEHRFNRPELIAAMRAGEEVSTSPPEVGAFFWAYQDALSSGASAVVSIHISGRMSATARAAQEAAQQTPVPVHVVDSQTTGMSLGFAALSAARAAAAGAQLRRVLDAATYRSQTSTELLYVDTLDYLRRGGRIGGAAAWVGTALSLKPLLTVREGEVRPVSRVPGRRRAQAKLVDLAVDRAGTRPVDVAVVRFGDDEQVLDLADQLRKRVRDVRDLVVAEASTVIGAHVGPGALGITVSPAG
ncbi:DegV family protein [Amycolatopsis suaedae]|uniref:DegV family protein n=1 Tax=Amycolatopsis suaedae TaxID=2510978 RepID=A0A4Q7JB49_9PSEU|nr:DegV family protein [Amycolatopsis suaedae]RZQ64507.1 DegV family protein [Amycolatopsis suaedae]